MYLFIGISPCKSNKWKGAIIHMSHIQPHLLELPYYRTVNRIAGRGVRLCACIIPINCGKWPSRAPTKNNLENPNNYQDETTACIDIYVGICCICY